MRTAGSGHNPSLGSLIDHGKDARCCNLPAVPDQRFIQLAIVDYKVKTADSDFPPRNYTTMHQGIDAIFKLEHIS